MSGEVESMADRLRRLAAGDDVDQAVMVAAADYITALENHVNKLLDENERLRSFLAEMTAQGLGPA